MDAITPESGGHEPMIDHAGHELRRAQDAYETLLENSVQGILVTRKGAIVFANPAYCRISGYTAIELLALPSFLDTIHPDDREAIRDRYQRRLSGHPLAPRYVTRMLRKDGTIRAVEVYASTTFFRGDTAIQASVLDITEQRQAEEELRQSEERYRTVFSSVLDGVVIFEFASQRVVDANPAALQIYGYARDEFLSLGLSDLSTEHEAAAASFREIMDGGAVRIPLRYHRRRDGSRFPVEISACRLIWKDKPFVCGIIRDITERLRADDERRIFSSRLVEVQEAERLQISETMHDEIGQLLTLSRLDLGGLSFADPHARAAVAAAISHIDQTLAAVRRLATSLRPAILDGLSIGTALTSLTEEFRSSARVRVEFAMSSSLPDLDRSTRTCLYRTLQEALTNAARHSSCRRVSVRVDMDGPRIRLRVEDDGVGFDTTIRSAGIGLIGMRERAQRCGGELWIESQPGAGCKLCLVIPPVVASPNLDGRQHEDATRTATG